MTRTLPLRWISVLSVLALLGIWAAVSAAGLFREEALPSPAK